MSSCSFISGGSTVSVYCEDGCCSNECCDSDDDDETLIAIIVACVVGGLIILLLLALCIWCIMRKSKNNDDDDSDKRSDKKVLAKSYKGDKDRMHDLESGNKNKDNNKERKEKKPVTNNMVMSYAPIQSTMAKPKTKKRSVSPYTYSGTTNKMTQTINHRPQPGDKIMYASGEQYEPAEETTVYRRYLQDNQTFEAGTSTDGKDQKANQTQKTPRSHRWDSSSNFYTRRDSLKGSSEEDEPLPITPRTENTSRNRKGETVNMYSLAARDSKKKNDEKKMREALAVWQDKPQWQPHTHPASQSPAQKRWKETMLYVQKPK